MNHILAEDIRYIHSKVDFAKFEGTTVLVTGATGLIGSLIIRSLLEWNKKC